MNFVTNIEVIDFQILLQLDVGVLHGLRFSNKYLHGIINTAYFWKEKFKYDKLPLMNENITKSWEWFHEYGKVNHFIDMASKLLIIYDIECNNGNDEPICIHMDDFIPGIAVKGIEEEFKKFIEENNIENYEIKLKLVPEDGFWVVDCALFDYEAEEEIYSIAAFCNFDNLLTLLFRACYYHLDIDDDDFSDYLIDSDRDFDDMNPVEIRRQGYLDMLDNMEENLFGHFLYNIKKKYPLERQTKCPCGHCLEDSDEEDEEKNKLMFM